MDRTLEKYLPLSRLDSMTLPAELTMGVIGLYGLYFAAVSFNQARRKKRSLQGNYIITGILTLKADEIKLSLDWN